MAAVDPGAFLEREYSASEAPPRVEFDPAGDRPHYWIQWWEPASGRGIGWHCDATEPEYGPVHRQVDTAEGTTTRQPAAHVDDEHPSRSFERRLAHLPAVIADLDRA